MSIKDLLAIWAMEDANELLNSFDAIDRQDGRQNLSGNDDDDDDDDPHVGARVAEKDNNNDNQRFDRLVMKTSDIDNKVCTSLTTCIRSILNTISTTIEIVYN